MIKKILQEQNPHWNGALSTYAKREQFATLVRYLPLKHIITITGIRRCGKSTLAKTAIHHLIETGVNPKNILFVNLEQPFFLEYRHDATYLETIYEEYLKLLGPKGKIYVIFDEIQFFENWQIYIKSKYESSDIKFIITGSNSSMLSNDLGTLLTGRSLNIHLDTFSFAEFLDFKGIDYADELARLGNRIEIARAKEEYLRWGGFYEVFTVEDTFTKKEILISYAKNIIYRDIVPRYGIRNSESIERLFFYLIGNACTMLNYTTLASTFELSDKTIKEYIHYFEETFLVSRIDRFHTKPKERIKSMKKIYLKDNGFLQIVPKFSDNLGAALENGVFNVLAQKHETLTYLKDTYEIDFYVDKTLYQVSYDISDEKTKKRELNAFEAFKKGDESCKLITYESDEIIGEVEVVSFERFALP
ncbi:ATP-binding protein [Sulfuricurvum sp.]|uniref:ATP-binding protein n=1 Tax=Sulfuricurvum sp. TaxID=2025608 RepID=UPI003BB4EE33